MKIKVCGMRDPGNLEEVCGLAPEFVGYIFFSGSKRYVGKDPDPALFSIPAKKAVRVGVFVNESVREVKRMVNAGWLDMVQLHGGESPAYCLDLAKEGIPVMKVLDPSLLPRGLKDFTEGIDWFLFDTPGEGFGGTGRKFRWELLKSYSGSVPFMLSGGIGPGDAGLALALDLPSLYGVDVNSRFEIAPGLKDIGLLDSFIREIRK